MSNVHIPIINTIKLYIILYYYNVSSSTNQEVPRWFLILIKNKRNYNRQKKIVYI